MTWKWRILKRSKSRPSRDWNKITPAGSVTRPNASKRIKTRSCPSSRTCWRTGKKRYVHAWLLMHVGWLLINLEAICMSYMSTVCLITQTVVSLGVRSDHLWCGVFFSFSLPDDVRMQRVIPDCAPLPARCGSCVVINLLCLPLKQNSAGRIKFWHLLCAASFRPTCSAYAPVLAALLRQ